MTKQIIRIEIPSTVTETMYRFWIGQGLQLVDDRALAIPVSDDEHLYVMNLIQCVATAYGEGRHD